MLSTHSDHWFIPVKAGTVLSASLVLALNEGMRTLRQDGIEKVLDGTTDIKQVRKVCMR